MKKHGFTIVELLIVIAIMGILMTLSVVNMRDSQVNSRDVERKADIEAIVSSLETYYTSGTDGSTSFGFYPSTALTSSGSSYMTQTLRDIDTNSLKAPGISDPTQTFISATNNIQTTAGVLPQPTYSQYVYQPIASGGTLCTSSTECRKFNLYYRSEVDNNIYMVTSKKQ